MFASRTLNVNDFWPAFRLLRTDAREKLGNHAPPFLLWAVERGSRIWIRLRTSSRQQRVYIHIVIHDIEITGRDAHGLERRSILPGRL